MSEYKIRAAAISTNKRTIIELRQYEGHPRLKLVLVSTQEDNPGEWVLAEGDDYWAVVQDFAAEARERKMQAVG